MSPDTTRLASWERVCIPALVSSVPLRLAAYLSFDGFCDRLRYGHFVQGMSDTLLWAAFESWRDSAYRAGFAVKGREP